MRVLLPLLFSTLLFFSCQKTSLQSDEGYIEVTGGQVWYQVVAGGDKTPLLIIHGGPGSRSCNTIAGYSLLADERPVIFYDQLGSGKSARPEDTALWRLPRFVEELVLLREALDLEKVHLLGNSWGGAVLAEYMLTQDPEGVESVIFSGPLISTRRWMEDADTLVARLPASLRDTLRKYEQLQQYDAPAYLAATDSFYARHLCRRGWPPETNPSCEGVAGFNTQVYNYMWGPTEFTATGTLLDFDRSNRLGEIKVPALFVAGEYDEARPETMYAFQQLLPGSKVAIIEGAGHDKIGDEPEAFTRAIREFLREAEGGY